MVKFILWFEREREKMTRLLGATKIDQPMTKKETGFVFFWRESKNVKRQRPQQLISVFTWGRIF